ncbi:MAG TPA: trehalose-phosphatase [Alphaproteobacteria bacterium]|nr:trehalose-phosphatase [Alphaproteobacteria bacterium]
MAESSLSSRLRQLIDKRDQAAFLFDFDGTLVELVPDPDKVEVPPALIAALRAIAGQKDAGFAMITGRALARLDAFTDGVTTAAIGSHGAEFRPGPAMASAAIAEPMPAALREALGAIGAKHSCIVEDKAYTVSLHLPMVNARHDLRPELEAAAGADAKKYIFRKIGRTHEILQKAVTKGSGIEHLMKQPPFAGRAPVYFGDDTHTDESLGAVTAMGGVLCPVGTPDSEDGPSLRIDEARHVMALLAGIG